MMYSTHHRLTLVLLVFYLSIFSTNNYASANTNIVSAMAKSHKTHTLKARNFNKVFEQYMKEAQVYMPSSNETSIENHFYDDSNKDTLKNCDAELLAFEFVYE